jgi:predicted nucleic-acid-binding protein
MAYAIRLSLRQPRSTIQALLPPLRRAKLAAPYGWDRGTIHGRLSRLLRTRGVFIEELELVQQALDEYLVGKASLSDYLILRKARSAPGGELVTFDRKLAREHGVTLL